MCRQLLAWGYVASLLKCGKPWEEQMHMLDETAQLQPEQAPGNRQSRLLWEAAACTERQKSLADSVTLVHC